MRSEKKWHISRCERTKWTDNQFRFLLLKILLQWFFLEHMQIFFMDLWKLNFFFFDDAFIDFAYSHIGFFPQKIKMPNEIWQKLAHHLDVLGFIFASEWTNRPIISSYGGSTGNVCSCLFRLNMFLMMHLYVLVFDK